MVALKLTPASTLTHILVFSSIVIVSIWVYELGGLGSTDHELFNWHPLLMTLAYMLFMTEGVLAYVCLDGSHSEKKIIHLILQACSLFFSLLGVYVVFDFHAENKYPDLYSVHSWVGLLTIFLFGLQFLGGFMTFYRSQATVQRRQEFLPYHKFLGAVTVGCAYGAMMLGAFDKQAMLPKDDVYSFSRMLANSFSIVVVATGAAVLFQISEVGRPTEAPSSEMYDIVS